MAAVDERDGVGVTFRPDDDECRRARRPVLLADNDGAGRKPNDQVDTICCGIAAEIWALRLPGRPPKGAVVDGLAVDQITSVTDLETRHHPPGPSDVAALRRILILLDQSLRPAGR